MRKDIRTQKTIVLLMNILLVIMMFLSFLFFLELIYERAIDFYSKGYILLSLVYVSIFTGFMILYSGFKIDSVRIFDMFFSFAISIIFTLFLSYFEISLISRKLVNPFGIFMIFIIQLIFGYSLIYIEHRLFYILFKPKKVLAISQDLKSSVLIKLIKYQYKNLDISNVISLNDYLNSSDNFSEFECILVTNISQDYKEKIAKFCYDNNKTMYIVPSIYDVLINNSKDTHFIDTPIFHVNNFGPSQYSKIVKRIVDIIISSLFLLISSPIFVIVAIAIKIDDSGPVFFYQNRLTIYGNVFKIIKFRSMKVDAEKNTGALLASKADPRITRVGKIIRKLRIDELPQFINIIKGEMSFVGPRPERPEIASKTVIDFPEFEYRLKVKAGLTGYAQVYGKYNTSLEDKLLLDIMYIENFSLLLDIKIIILTIKILFIKDSTEGV